MQSWQPSPTQARLWKWENRTCRVLIRTWRKRIQNSPTTYHLLIYFNHCGSSDWNRKISASNVVRTGSNYPVFYSPLNLCHECRRSPSHFFLRSSSSFYIQCPWRSICAYTKRLQGFTFYIQARRSYSWSWLYVFQTSRMYSSFRFGPSGLSCRFAPFASRGLAILRHSHGARDRE